MTEPQYWNIRVTILCPDCGYQLDDDNIRGAKKEYSPVHGIEMDFITCPVCEFKGIYLP